jgi:predicted ATPase with chaperone activity
MGDLEDSLLAKLARMRSAPHGDDNVWDELEASPPQHSSVPTPPETDTAHDLSDEEKLNHLLSRIESLSDGVRENSSEPPPPTQKSNFPTEVFIPLQKRSLDEMELTESEVEELALKFLLSRGDASGREISEQIRIPFMLVEVLMRRVKEDQLVVFRGTAPMNDYIYQLTDLGRERGKRLVEHCTYFGSAPVSLQDYVESVKAQSLTHQNPHPEDLKLAFQDLLISPQMLRRLGPAINSGRGMFLFGEPGNGKTSIAKRVTRAFGKHIWIPRSIGVDGEIIRLFDPMNHEEAPLSKQDGLIDEIKVDHRWVRIRRPTIVVGGELTMHQLEVTFNKTTGISEAPLQMKSNCGSLVIDDFGRQRMAVDELLNRWIVPLEERIDFLNLPSGKKLQVPFDQLIVFATNLEPRELVDEAFLRRIPYKIEVVDPTEDEFKTLFRRMCAELKIKYDEACIAYLVDEHYKKANRPFRCCHPRDLLMQIRNYCRYQQKPVELSKDFFDFAIENYFAVM